MDQFLNIKTYDGDNTAQPTRRTRITKGDYVNLAVLLVISLLFIYPFWNIYISAFNDARDSARGSLYLLPRKFTLDNIIFAFRNQSIYTGFIVTILRTGIGTILHVICCATAGYALTKKSMPGRAFFAMFFFVAGLFGGGLIPVFILFRQIGLYNNFLVYIIPGLYSFGNMIIFRCFINALPDGLEEAAHIDGASPTRIFFSIIVPLTMPAFATLGLFAAIGHWNDWMTAMLFTQNPRIHPLAYILQRIVMEADIVTRLFQSGESAKAQEMAKKITPQSIRQGVLVISVTPIILVYPFAQKYFVKGITIGSVKG